MTRPLPLPDLVTDLSLPYRLYPANGTPQGLILLLHGIGNNETSLAGLGPHLPKDHSIALVRSAYTMGPNAFSAFAVNFTPQGPIIDKTEAEASRLALIRFVGELQQRVGVAPEHTLIAGFSQGGIMSAGLALTQPELVAGFAILSGRILPEIEPLIPAQEKLRHLKALILHGEADGTLPITWADRSAELLKAHQVPFSLHKFQARHEMTEEMVEAFVKWVKL
ncbi:phospholipase/carboxylesterase [Denitratisoma sp. agr-D3]